MDLPFGERRLLVAGEWLDTGSWHRVTAPWDGAHLANVAWADLDHVRAAIAGAAQALQRGMPQHERARVLEAAAHGIAERADELAAAICRESGKPIAAARVEAARAVSTFEAAAVAARTLAGHIVPMEAWESGERKLGFTVRRPVGVVAGITPFNFPLNLVAHKVAPAIAAGCPIVLKPSERTPISALLLAEILESAGLPLDWLSVVVGQAAPIGELFCDDPNVHMISFTGSAQVGWQLRARAATKKVALELGNATPVIVEPGADLALAAERCSVGGFTFAGQTCVSVQRVFVNASLFDAFVERFVEHVRGLAVGDPGDEATVVGPLIQPEALERVRGWIDEATAAGARLLTGGGERDGVLEPTVLTETTPEMKIATREVFGPVVIVEAHHDLGDALQRADATPYGLQAAIFTGDVAGAVAATAQLRFGAVMINESPSFRADHMPYGGTKQSGNSTEGPLYTAREMTEEQLVVVQLP